MEDGVVSIEIPDSKTSLQVWRKYIHSIPLLTEEEEEISLAKAKDRGDEKARERMIVSNLRLVDNIARKLDFLTIETGMDFSDLVQEGNIGLIKAVNKFD